MSGPVAGACAAAAGQLLRRIRRGLLVVPLGLGGRWRRFRPDPVLRTGRRLGGLYDAPVRAGTSVTKARILVAIGLEGWVRLPKTASRSRAQFLIGRPSRGGPALAAPARPGPARGASTSHGLRSRPIPLTPLWGGAQGESGSWARGALSPALPSAECLSLPPPTRNAMVKEFVEICRFHRRIRGSASTNPCDLRTGFRPHSSPGACNRDSAVNRRIRPPPRGAGFDCRRCGPVRADHASAGRPAER